MTYFPAALRGARDFFRAVLLVAVPSIFLVALGAAGGAMAQSAPDAPAKIAPRQARPGHDRPLAAVIGQKDGTVLTAQAQRTLL